MPSGAQDIQTRFLNSLAAEASAEEVAEAAVLIWRDINAALAPIIGQPGVVALLRRSQYLVREAYPWLASFQHVTPAVPAFDPLHAALSAQSAADSTQGNSALLQVFHDILASLIGASLCERLLRSSGTFPISGPAAKELTQ